MPATALPLHIPTALEANTHLVSAIRNDGSITVKDSISGEQRTMRLGLIDVGGKLTLVALGDP